MLNKKKYGIYNLVNEQNLLDHLVRKRRKEDMEVVTSGVSDAQEIKTISAPPPVIATGKSSKSKTTKISKNKF